MCSCQSSSSSTITMLVHNFHRLSLRSSPRFRCVLDQIAPNLAVSSSSLSSVFTSANLVAAAAASGSGTVHGAVTSTITQVAVTAVAIASGACLSTKVDFLWPKLESQPGCVIVEGVDVTGYPIFNDPKVQKAIAFAKKAHHGQLRKTGDPYLVHCIHTGRILAMLVPSSGERAVHTVVAGILHDVVDDTCKSFNHIEEEFGDDVAKLVAGVSRLSYINQLLRRHRRINVNDGRLGHEEANNLRVMLLGMVDDPRVVLIKLADRLHNMRTIYALPPEKAQAVARETLVIWCSLASRLGLWAMKAELEDLCFAVLQPQMFKNMRADLASMWSSSSKVGNSKRISARATLNEGSSVSDNERSIDDEEVTTMKDLLEAVVPFDVLLDRRKRSNFLSTLGQDLQTHKIPKVVHDAGIALASLVICEEALEQELIISTSYVPGMEVTLSSRLKSLYSIYSKMKRKDVSINKVYDARALRVVVGDKNGTLHGPAVQCCYSLLDTVHKHWTPIDGEFDDYIVNPKPSGYQSLHTAVQGPDRSPLEVQIRTQRMHEYAEHGLAAHWLYKETGTKVSNRSSTDESEIDASSFLSKHLQALRDEENKDCTEFKDSDAELVVSSFVNPLPAARVLPSVVFEKEGGNNFLNFAKRYRETKGILVNTFLELEPHALQSLSSDGKIPPVYPVGPILNVKSEGNQVSSEKSKQKSDILEWLDDQPPSSVVFLCFGSMGCFGEDQVKEIAHALEQGGFRFLWSLRQPSKEKIGFPSDYTDYKAVLPEGFLDRTTELGKVIGWAPQLAILAHPAVGGFVSHCGWNSTLESIWYGVPIATWPFYAEQQVNAFELVKELKLAVEIDMGYRKDSGVIVSRENIEKGIKEVMEQESELRKRVKEMSQMSRKALEEDGSSYSSLGRFLDQIQTS